MGFFIPPTTPGDPVNQALRSRSRYVLIASSRGLEIPNEALRGRPNAIDRLGNLTLGDRANPIGFAHPDLRVYVFSARW